MKKSCSILLVLVLVLGVAACGDLKSAETELVVFAAASMSGVLTEIAAQYTEADIIFNFDSSGTLRTQIQMGAEADLFLSAATQEMDALAAQGLIEPGTRIDLLENQVVLVAAPDNPSGIACFQDMAVSLVSGDVLMAMGNIDVPVGRYTQAVLAYFGLDHETLAGQGAISYGANVREVAMQVRESSVDFGLVYLTDALEFGLSVLDIATAEMIGRVVYPAAVLRDSQHPEAAQAFLDFLAEAETMAIFDTWGFVVAES
ncbi:MAG: molybdate ABC transporter substrate-binding protein [Oscillospiraceae bacterium]|nr:molybdate ABC transporter substrate-binding protein [Oscillospiraceae bacterium]